MSPPGGARGAKNRVFGPRGAEKSRSALREGGAPRVESLASPIRQDQGVGTARDPAKAFRPYILAKILLDLFSAISYLFVILLVRSAALTPTPSDHLVHDTA